MEDLTPEQIAQSYSSAMDSVNLINALLAQSIHTDEDLDTIHRNVQHLGIMTTKDYWTTEDLTPFYEAISAGRALID
jgi:hypothetical protein